MWEERRESSGFAGAESAVTLFLVTFGVSLSVAVLVLLVFCVISRPPLLSFFGVLCVSTHCGAIVRLNFPCPPPGPRTSPALCLVSCNFSTVVPNGFV